MSCRVCKNEPCTRTKDLEFLQSTREAIMTMGSTIRVQHKKTIQLKADLKKYEATQDVLAADFSDSVAAEIILTKVTETVRKLQKDGLTSSKKDNDLQGERIALKKSIADICGRGYMNPDFQHDWYYTRDYPEELDHAAEDTRIGVCTYCDAIANGCNEYYYESCTIFE